MSWFPEYAIESAPPGSRRFMLATQNHLGYLPDATARWAVSPHLLEGFGRMTAIFENSTLDPVAREVVVMTVATRNGCRVCVAMHTARLTALGAPPEVVAALRSASPLADERLEPVDRLARGLLGDPQPTAGLAGGGPAQADGLQREAVRGTQVRVPAPGQFGVQFVDDRPEPAEQEQRQLEPVHGPVFFV